MSAQDNKYFVDSFEKFLSKMNPAAKSPAGAPPLSEVFWGFCGALIGMGLVCYLSHVHELPVLIASFGASAVLLFGAPAAPLAQPRNALGGHIIAAIVGVCVFQLIGNYWFTLALGVAVTVALMTITKTVHPPAGATALIAIITEQDWTFVFLPIGAGITILILVAVLFNNLAQKRSYPTYWW